MPPQIQNKIQFGRDAHRNLKVRISSTLRHREWPSFKIGITANPIQRVAFGSYDHYDELILLYRTNSLSQIRRVESDLIDFYHSHSDNLAPGGGGSIGTCTAPYYLYLVVGDQVPAGNWGPAVGLGAAGILLAAMMRR